MTGVDALTGLAATGEAGPLIPHSQGTSPLNGPWDKPLNLLIPQRERPCPLEEAHDLDHGADLQAQILLAAVAAQEVEVNQIAAQVMDPGRVLFSHQLHMFLLLQLQWYLTQMNHAGVLE